MELWEEKWDEFKKLSEEVAVRRGRGLAHGKEVWNELPKYLYHVTPKLTWEKIKSSGYLGTRYVEKGVDRSWQKLGIGVFLATNSASCVEYLAPDLSTGTALSELILLKVPKDVLDPEKVYLDGDVFGDKKVKNMSDISKSLWSVFYAGKISVQDILPLKKVSTRRYVGQKELDQILKKTLEIFNPISLEIQEKLGPLVKEQVHLPKEVEGLFQVNSVPGITGLSLRVFLKEGGRTVLSIYVDGSSYSEDIVKNLLLKKECPKCLSCDRIYVSQSSFEDWLKNPYNDWQQPNLLS